jgi:hypothetical protein
MIKADFAEKNIPPVFIAATDAKNLLFLSER